MCSKMHFISSDRGVTDITVWAFVVNFNYFIAVIFYFHFVPNAVNSEDFSRGTPVMIGVFEEEGERALLF